MCTLCKLKLTLTKILNKFKNLAERLFLQATMWYTCYFYSTFFSYFSLLVLTMGATRYTNFSHMLYNTNEEFSWEFLIGRSDEPSHVIIFEVKKNKNQGENCDVTQKWLNVKIQKFYWFFQYYLWNMRSYWKLENDFSF